MIDSSSLISMGSAGVVVVSLWMTNKYIMSNLQESLAEFKKDIKDEIKKEKSHAMELASQRLTTIEKDVDEIFPRLRKAEDNVNKNCYAITTMQQNCIRHKSEPKTEANRP